MNPTNGTILIIISKSKSTHLNYEQLTKETTYNFQLVLIITYMLLTYPQVNLHVHGSLKRFSEKCLKPAKFIRAYFLQKTDSTFPPDSFFTHLNFKFRIGLMQTLFPDYW